MTELSPSLQALDHTNPVRFADTSPRNAAVDCVVRNLASGELDATWIGCPGQRPAPAKPLDLWGGPLGIAIFTGLATFGFAAVIAWFMYPNPALIYLAFPVLCPPLIGYLASREALRKFDHSIATQPVAEAFAIMPDGLASAAVFSDGSHVLRTIPWEALTSITWSVHDSVVERIRFLHADGAMEWDQPHAIEGQPDAGACIVACSDHIPVCFVIANSSAPASVDEE